MKKKNYDEGYVGNLFPDFFPNENEQPVNDNADVVSPSEKQSPKATIEALKGEIFELTAEVECLSQENRELEEKLKKYDELEAKVQSYEEMLGSKSAFPTNVVAKSMGWTAIRLNNYLKEKKVQYKRGEVWTLYRDYDDKGYTAISWYAYAKDTKDRDLTRAHMYWTMKGIAFIRSLLKKDGLLEE